ncbi:MAG: hypothetical protein U9R60_00715 [Bacteroidota bacterium]|nr:hypothetical protein [Bacteroidota bacterium]
MALRNLCPRAGQQAIAVVFRISQRIGIGYGQKFTILTVMHNRACEKTELSGLFDLDGYRIPCCPMFQRFDRIDRPVKPDRVENSANCSATRNIQHGRNLHSSGIFTFFSLEEGSNFVQKIRQ